MLKTKADYKKNWNGIFTALITPFRGGQVDFSSLQNLVEQQLNGGVKGFVVNGTTAESPTLEWDEVEAIFQCVKKKVAGRVPLIMGTGSNSTHKTIETTLKAEKLGADAALVVVPYYNKPTQEGLFQHFSNVAESTHLPVILYNVPGRTVTSMTAETTARLSEKKNIIGIKEASGDMTLAKNTLQKVSADFFLWSGDDGTYLDLMLLGGTGCISVLSHVLPELTQKWAERALQKDVSVIQDFEKYKNLTNLLFKEPNPTVVKTALKYLKVIESDELRLPLLSTTDAVQKELYSEMKKLELL